MLSTLPNEVLLLIVSLLAYYDILNLCCCCKSLSQITTQPEFWLKLVNIRYNSIKTSRQYWLPILGDSWSFDFLLDKMDTPQTFFRRYSQYNLLLARSDIRKYLHLCFNRQDLYTGAYLGFLVIQINLTGLAKEKAKSITFGPSFQQLKLSQSRVLRKDYYDETKPCVYSLSLSGRSKSIYLYNATPDLLKMATFVINYFGFNANITTCVTV